MTRSLTRVIIYPNRNPNGGTMVVECIGHKRRVYVYERSDRVARRLEWLLEKIAEPVQDTGRMIVYGKVLEPIGEPA